MGSQTLLGEMNTMGGKDAHGFRDREETAISFTVKKSLVKSNSWAHGDKGFVFCLFSGRHMR